MRSPKSRGCGWERCLLRDHLRGKTVIGRYLMFEIKREVTYWLTVTCLGLKAFTKHRSGTQLTYHSTNIHQECRGFHCRGQRWLVQTLLLRVRCFQKKYRLLLDHGSENWSKGPSPVFVNDVCQSAGSRHSFADCPQLLSRSPGSVENVQQRPKCLPAWNVYHLTLYRRAWSPPLYTKPFSASALLTVGAT